MAVKRAGPGPSEKWSASARTRHHYARPCHMRSENGDMGRTPRKDGILRPTLGPQTLPGRGPSMLPPFCANPINPPGPKKPTLKPCDPKNDTTQDVAKCKTAPKHLTKAVQITGPILRVGRYVPPSLFRQGRPGPLNRSGPIYFTGPIDAGASGPSRCAAQPSAPYILNDRPSAKTMEEGLRLCGALQNFSPFKTFGCNPRLRGRIQISPPSWLPSVGEGWGFWKIKVPWVKLHQSFLEHQPLKGDTRRSLNKPSTKLN